jgi:hypothetical protein
LYKRPRIDYRVSEYVYEYIERQILKPRKIKELEFGKYILAIRLYFLLLGKDSKSLNVEQFYSEDSSYNTVNTIYYSRDVRHELRLGYKTINLYCCSTDIDKNIKPKEYANHIYNMIGTFLEAKRYKSITKEIMERYKSEMDYAYIESFAYPAPGVYQRYVGEGYDVYTRPMSECAEYEGLKGRENYMKFYGENDEKTYEDGKLGLFVANDFFSCYTIDKYRLNENIISIEVKAKTINELKGCLDHLYKIIDNMNDNELGKLYKKVYYDLLKRYDEELAVIEEYESKKEYNVFAKMHKSIYIKRDRKELTYEKFINEVKINKIVYYAKKFSLNAEFQFEIEFDLSEKWTNHHFGRIIPVSAYFDKNNNVRSINWH